MPVSLPSWPARLQAPMAAAYVGLLNEDGTPDVSTFREHVRKGLYPKGHRRSGERMGWLKAELDQVLESMTSSDEVTLT